MNKISQLAKQSLPFLIFATTPFVIGLLYRCSDLEICGWRNIISSSTFTILNPLLTFSEWVIIPMFLLIFIQTKVFRSWLRFAAYFIPVAVILIALTPTSSPYLFDFYPFYRTDMAQLMGQIFAVGTLLLIARKYYILHRSSPSKPPSL